MDQPSKPLIGGGVLGLAGAFLGREFLVWAYGKILDAFSGLFTGESPKMTVPTPFPWVDTIGIGLMVLGLYFLVSSYRRPKAAPPNEPPLSAGGDRAHFEAKVGDPPPFNPEGLYTGMINASTHKLADERFLVITARCFNATGQAIYVHRAEGQVDVTEYENGQGKHVGILPPLHIVLGRLKDREIQNTKSSRFLWSSELRPNCG